MIAHNATTPSPRYAARAPRSVSLYSMMRYVRGSRATGFKHAGQDRSKLLASTGRGVGGIASRPPAWGWSAPRDGSQCNHARFALRGACSAVRQALLHDAIRAQDARNGIRTR